MTKKTILAAFTLLFITFSFTARAQRGNQTSLSIGSEWGIPLNMSEYRNYGNDGYRSTFAINLTLEKPITQTLHFTANTGLFFMESGSNYLFSTVNPSTGNGSDIFNDNYHRVYVNLPVTAGLKYYWAKYFYINAEAGGAFKISYRASTSFIYSGGAGAVVPIGPHHGLDFGLRFERGYKNADYNKTIDQIGLNVAYKYRF